MGQQSRWEEQNSMKGLVIGKVGAGTDCTKIVQREADQKRETFRTKNKINK
jgi:hypothetical protein